MELMQAGQLPYITAAMRPRQWTKNLVVFAAILFSFSINRERLLGSTLAFCLLCTTSSSFYLINDIFDIASDRKHPVKCKRPIASGAVSVKVAASVSSILLCSSLLFAWWYSPALGATVMVYAILQVAYNAKLKHVVIWDVGAIAMGFVIRACAGAAATGISLSPWFTLCTGMLALFLGIEKRKAELLLVERSGYKGRRVLSHYSRGLLARMESTVTTGTLMAYSLWSAGPVVNGAPTAWMMLTIPFVLYGIFRYQLLSEAQPVRHGDVFEYVSAITERPDEVLLGDTAMLLTVASWVVACMTILGLEQHGAI